MKSLLLLAILGMLAGCGRAKVPHERFTMKLGLLMRDYISIHDSRGEICRFYDTNLSSTTFIFESMDVRDLNNEEKYWLSKP